MLFEFEKDCSLGLIVIPELFPLLFSKKYQKFLLDWSKDCFCKVSSCFKNTASTPQYLFMLSIGIGYKKNFRLINLNKFNFVQKINYSNNFIFVKFFYILIIFITLL